MTNKEKKHIQKVSRLLAKVLRHSPEDLGIALDEAGWVDVSALLNALDEYGLPTTTAQLETIVATNDKKRFTLSPEHQKIRAAQGHSVEVTLGLSPKTPPTVLYHGTAASAVDAIMTEGLRPQSRQQVHLSADTQTATKVGKRHGAPVILTVDTKAMLAKGARFFQADNGVWLTDAVAPEFLNVTDATKT